MAVSCMLLRVKERTQFICVDASFSSNFIDVQALWHEISSHKTRVTVQGWIMTSDPDSLKISATLTSLTNPSADDTKCCRR